MLAQDGKNFRRSLIGYDRASVDSEFARLLEQAESFSGERLELQERIDSLTKDKIQIDRADIQLRTQLDSMTTKYSDLQASLSQAKAENDTLSHAIEAHKAEKNAMQVRFDQLRERDRDYSLREREFAELQSSVSSIMSVTKRATDRLFQKVVENQERVTQIAGDAAREVAAIRADMNGVREQLNQALDEVQDRIDRVDASLTGAVHKLVAIKHDDGLHTADDAPDILSEVERLLSMRAGEVDYSDGKPFSAPSLGPYGAKFVADTAKRVSEGKISARVQSEGVAVHRVNPSNFESTADSTLEASKLLERGGRTAADYYDENPQFRPYAPEPVERPSVIPMGFAVSDPEPEPEVEEPEEPVVFEEAGEDSVQFVPILPENDSAADNGSWAPDKDDIIAPPPPPVYVPQFADESADDEFGSVDFTNPSSNNFGGSNLYNESSMYVGDNINAAGGMETGSASFRYYPVRSYSYQSQPARETSVQSGRADSSAVAGQSVNVGRRSERSPKHVAVRVVRGRR